jgi:phage major head subunit gpT-like protein
MELNSAAITAFKTKFDTEFNKAFELAATNYEKASYVFNSGRVETVTHRWMTGLTGMKEFVGARQINNVNSKGFSLSNKLWEDTVGIRRVDLERDQYGIYTPLVSRIGQVAKQHRDKLVFEQLSDAIASSTRAANVAYDSQAFFGTHTRSNTSFNYTNLATGAGSALAEASLITGIVNLRKRTDDKGNKLAAASAKPLLIIPPDLEFTAQKLLNSSFYPGVAPGASATQSSSNLVAAAENILKGAADIVVSPWLKTSTEWYLVLNESPMLKPVIFQLEQDVEIMTWDKFLHRWADYDEMTWGVRALYNVGVGLPEAVYGSTGS